MHITLFIANTLVDEMRLKLENRERNWSIVNRFNTAREDLRYQRSLFDTSTQDNRSLSDMNDIIYNLRGAETEYESANRQIIELQSSLRGRQTGKY